MQNATVAQRSARDAYFEGDTSTVNQAEVDINAPRFIVQMGWKVLQVDTNGVPNRYLLRGEITPVRSFKQKSHKFEIPEGMMIKGSEEADNDGKIVYGSYWKNAYYEAQRLIDNENSATYKNGIFEIKSLSGIKIDLYKKVDLTRLFYPEWPVLPEKNDDLKWLLEERLVQLKYTPPENIDPYWYPAIYELGEELIFAVDRADFIQRDRLTYTHSCMKLTPKDEGFKRQYDIVDYEMLQRTGLPQIHSAEIATAQALEKLTDRTGDNSTLVAMMEGQNKLIELIGKQVEQQGQILETILAEKNTKAQRNKDVKAT